MSEFVAYYPGYYLQMEVLKKMQAAQKIISGTNHLFLCNPDMLDKEEDLEELLAWQKAELFEVMSSLYHDIKTKVKKTGKREVYPEIEEFGQFVLNNRSSKELKYKKLVFYYDVIVNFIDYYGLTKMERKEASDLADGLAEEAVD